MIAKLASLPLAHPVVLGHSSAVLKRAARSVADYDLIILGGGCAGLSLAMRIASLGASCPRTLIIDKRSEYANDRTWCFWGEGSATVRHLVTYAWKRAALSSTTRCVEVDCSAMPYQMITGQAFYAHALQTIEASGRIDLIMGQAILSPPCKTGGEWQIETSEGSYSGSAVVDTRPDHDAFRPQDVLLWQSFYGREIECESAVFDPTVINLMDFSGVSDSSIRFTYLLPLSRTRAIVEATAFGPTRMTPEDFTADLRLGIAKQVKGLRCRTLRSESGMVPMGSSLVRHSSDPTYIRAGLTAGAARPSTGYAFQRIQRWADSCAQLIARGEMPVSHKTDPILLRSLDHLFVSVLRSRPELGPDLFLSLFEKTDTARLIRFLSDRGSVADYMAIAGALPVLPFLREIPRAIYRKTQS